MNTPHGTFDFKPRSGAHRLALDPRHAADDRARFERLLAAVSPQGSGVWIATSGTTRKGGDQYTFLAISDEALTASARAVNTHLGVTSRDVFVSCLPDFHVGGLGIQVRAGAAGARFERSVGNARPWDAAAFAAEVERLQGTILSLVPTQLNDLAARSTPAPRSVRAVIVGGGALARGEYRRARALGWPVLPSYGCTECASQVATASLDTLGAPANELPDLMVLSHVEVRVCNSIIELKSPALFSHRAVISGEQVSVETCEPGGWLQTSDRGELHGAVLRPLGRTDDLIKVGGEGVNMHELSVLMRDLRAESALPGDAALDAAPDDRLGAKVVLRTTDSALGEELRTQFNKLVLPFARIREVITVDKIARTPLGKVVRS